MFAVFAGLAPILRLLEPEHAHQIALLGLRLGLTGKVSRPDDPILRLSALGQDFSNPIGLAAGFDKNAVAPQALERLGFGFTESGTVTPRPQPGNPKPRLFRLEADRAVINRMGFNNHGIEAFVRRLSSGRPRAAPVGANIGINKIGADPEFDYPMMVGALASRADYIVINVSSPNTPGLRDLQTEHRLGSILRAIAVAVPAHPPLLVKLAPDLANDALFQLIDTCIAEGVQGLVISNTSLARPSSLRSRNSNETGGLSGAPLFRPSTTMLAKAFCRARDRLTLIGVGGVASGADALRKIRAGASLVQIYSSFVFEGPSIVPRIKAELAAGLREAGFASVEDAIGSGAEQEARVG